MSYDQEKADLLQQLADARSRMVSAETELALLRRHPPETASNAAAASAPCSCPVCVVRCEALHMAKMVVIAAAGGVSYTGMQILTPSGVAEVRVLVLSDLGFDRIVAPALRAELGPEMFHSANCKCGQHP